MSSKHAADDAPGEHPAYPRKKALRPQVPSGTGAKDLVPNGSAEQAAALEDALTMQDELIRAERYAMYGRQQ